MCVFIYTYINFNRMEFTFTTERHVKRCTPVDGDPPPPPNTHTRERARFVALIPDIVILKWLRLKILGVVFSY